MKLAESRMDISNTIKVIKLLELSSFSQLIIHVINRII